MKKQHDFIRAHSDSSISTLSGIADNQKNQATDALMLPPVFLMAVDSLLQDVRGRKINLSGLRLLIALYHGKDKAVRLSKLAKIIGITGAGITAVADNLDRIGLAAREAEPNDRRVILMRLTPHGMSFLQLLENSLVSSVGRAFLAHEGDKASFTPPR
jgi:DNA-binding MarR family transcriptional regulator